jgi:hypothetical protein
MLATGVIGTRKAKATRGRAGRDLPSRILITVTSAHFVIASMNERIAL